MKKVLGIVCAALGMAAVVAPAWSQSDLPQTTSPLETTVDLGYSSQYVWRGIQINEDAVIQPSITVTNKYGLSFNFWGSMDATNLNGYSGDFNELDYTASYAWTTPKNTELSAGLIRYTFPHTSANSTSEVFLSAAMPGKYAPTVCFNYDFAEAKGLYASACLGYDVSLKCVGMKKMPKMGLSAKVGFGSAGHNDFYYAGSNKAAFTDGLVSASFPFAVTDVMTITPSVSYSRILDSTLKNNVEASGAKADNFFMGVTTSFSF